MLPCVQISSFWDIPKGLTGKCRFIVDLSTPEGTSVNYMTNQRAFSLTYVPIDDVAREIASQGWHIQLAKIDIKSGYSMVQVHPEDRCSSQVYSGRKLHAPCYQSGCSHPQRSSQQLPMQPSRLCNRKGSTL